MCTSISINQSINLYLSEMCTLCTNTKYKNTKYKVQDTPSPIGLTVHYKRYGIYKKTHDSVYRECLLKSKQSKIYLAVVFISLSDINTVSFSSILNNLKFINSSDTILTYSSLKGALPPIFYGDRLMRHVIR